jgi:D-ribose pyranose/furanose isomerase RbsD
MLMPCCGLLPQQSEWQTAVGNQVAQLGYRNWIVVAEASFPAHNRSGIRQVSAGVEIPEALEHVLFALETTQHVSPRIYLPRELRAMENDYAPGIDAYRKRLKASLHGHEAVELDHESLEVLLADANRSFDVLVLRTTTALPYSSVFIELQPGYWDAESEQRLRSKIRRERLNRVTLPGR